MRGMSDLSTISFDPEYAPGARNAVHVCLRIQRGEKVTVITDRASVEVGACLPSSEGGLQYGPFVEVLRRVVAGIEGTGAG